MLKRMEHSPRILSKEEQEATLTPYMRQIINYRKTGLSLNHIVGCPLNCGYCVRHFWGNFESKVPQMLCSDDEAINTLLNHPFFVPHRTPLQIFNKATDPFLPTVKEHLFYILERLDSLGMTNFITVITRYKVTREDISRLEKIKNLKLSLFFTYSGIKDSRIEPIQASGITIKSIRTATKYRKNVKVILYWRPLVPGWNDDEATMNHVLEMGGLCDAIAFTGYYHREENAAYLESLGVEIPYKEHHRRKVLPKELDEKVVRVYHESGISTPLFRKTSCAATYVHGQPDYNGHWGVRELCDICPVSQQKRCAENYKTPTTEDIQEILSSAPVNSQSKFMVENGHVWTENLGEERRYYLQHALGFQTWDIDWPHFKHSHGRAPIGHKHETSWYQEKRAAFYQEVLYEDD